MITVTEEQAKIIEEVKNNWNHDDEFSHMRLLKKFTGLDNLTVLKIVEGEQYEVKREFKVGDLIRTKQFGERIFHIIDDDDIMSPDRVTKGFVESYRESVILVCKIENRDDLSKKEVSE